MKVSAGPMKGRVFIFAEHDTFISGRMDDCHCCLPDDIQMSRHHFFLEMNPPDATIHDFGSMNGTLVNGKKIGAREPEETPEEGLRRQDQEVDLKDGEAWASIYCKLVRASTAPILPARLWWNSLEPREEGIACRSYRCFTA